MSFWRSRGTAVRRSLALTAALSTVLTAGSLSLGLDRVAADGLSGCAPRLLVLSAFPAELGPLLAQARLQHADAVVVDGHGFYVGRLRGQNVVLALTGIGLVNARRTTLTALAHFRCGSHSGITGVVFSGVAGGDYIGDVIVPSRWTEDGKSWVHVNRAMARTVRRVAHGDIPLEQTTPLGDPLCSCVLSPDAIRTVRVEHTPQVEVGGNGLSTDPFGDHAFPCVPGAGDVFGCAPCRAHGAPSPDPTQLVTGLLPYINPSFFAAYAASTSPPAGSYVDEDMETAAVAKVAHRAGIPFIGVRGVSDGGGDPLKLPGFPVEFFVYRQLAADNAAAVTMAFLGAWKPAGS